MSVENLNPEQACLSCGSAERYENLSFRALPRVTSDSVPFPPQGRICICLHCGLIQKIIDHQWTHEIEAIYRDYKMYELTDGADQALFGEGGVTRAEKIVEILSRVIPERFFGTVLDIGCGTGGFLEVFGRSYPKAVLYGQEISNKNLRYLNRIPNFKTLFTSDALPGGQTFDVITSIHCFEHIYRYARYFNELKRMKGEMARILIQVPDVESSPFDIVVADHAAHFSENTLQRCLNRHANQFTVSRPVHKELTAIALPSSQSVAPAPVLTEDEYIQTLDSHVNTLTRLLAFIDDQKVKEFGVYGTTIAGAWVTGAYRDRIAFYVDDDPLKQGKIIHSKNILGADDIPANCKVILPFGMTAIQNILRRHPHLQNQAIYLD